MADLIDREAAITALDELCNMVCEYSKRQRRVMCVACNLGCAFDVLEQLEPAYSDMEKKGEDNGETD